MKINYLSKTFKGSILENEILYYEEAKNLLNPSRNAVKYWENQLKTDARKEFVKEQIAFFQDAVNLIEKKNRKKVMVA